MPALFGKQKLVRPPAILAYVGGVQSLVEQRWPTPAGGWNTVVVPDLWQQQAVAALRAGQDVVVQAPTGAGKTLIFELWSNQGRCRGQAIYTVPTRALANDKLAEWRARGWNVGITTGDLSDNLNAPVLVATLETQKARLLRGEGPDLLVVDEYQMLADPDRGLNYELVIAMAPPHTRLLLLSGSVANPHHVVRWLQRLGRPAVLIRHDQRPVPLEEVDPNQLSYHVPPEIAGYWPRLVAKALAEDLGPILIFAPRRQAAEALATDLARQLPNPHPLTLSPAQKQLVGEKLARLLKCRIAYHHSGLSYAARAGVIEPLAKAGQLRVVVATMGLAAGINFSLRSVALAADSYRRDEVETPLRPDEILQMFGRAGRRGLDETGFILITANQLRLRDAAPIHLHRCGLVDWAALLSVMNAAADAGRDPLAEAVRLQERLFTTQPITLGVEFALRHPDAPCGLKTDTERARHRRRRIREMLNSAGEWEPMPPPREVPVRDVRVPLWPGLPGGVRPATATAATAVTNEPMSLVPALAVPAALEKLGTGTLVVLEETADGRIHGRSLTVADLRPGDRVLLQKWVRRLVGWNARQVTRSAWDQQILPRLRERLAERRTPLVRLTQHDQRLSAEVSLAELPMRVPVDRHGVPLWRPLIREVPPYDCARCPWIESCKSLPPTPGTVWTWRRLGLVDEHGRPTLRGRLVSFFSQGHGLALAAALEDESYPLDELVYDLANLDAGYRFAGEENRWGGRLAAVCHARYGLQTIPGYLEHGVPPKYGSGAAEVAAAVHRNPQSKYSWVNEWIGVGDIDRMIIEWRSLLRQISHAPSLPWPRWQALQHLARTILNETDSPTLTDLPPLEPQQMRRVDHRLLLRRH